VLLLAAVTIFSVHDLASRGETERALDGLETKVQAAVPSVIELVEMRKAVRELRGEMLQASSAVVDYHVPPGHTDSFAQAESHYEAYKRTPALEGELAERAKIQGLLDELRRASDAVLTARDRAEAQRTFRDRFTRASDALAETVANLIKFKTEELAGLVATTKERQGLADAGAHVLLALLSASIIALGLAVHWFMARAQREQNRRLEELDAFAARVAHDLRGPLTPVTFALTVLEKGASLTDAQRHGLKAAQRSVGRMVALIEGLLHFARAGARPDPGARTHVDRVVADRLAALASLAAEERVEITSDLAPGLDVAASDAVLGSILDNLIRNALFHMSESERRHVTVRASATDRHVVIAVEDTGPGIPPDVARRLWKPFERGSTRPGGHGLGLATVKRLAEAHGGSVSLQSLVGVGSTFQVRLPRA
jgi:signal transduction histidine kinase